MRIWFEISLIKLIGLSMGRKRSIAHRLKATVRISMTMEKTAKFVEKRRNMDLSLAFIVFSAQ